MNVNAGDEFYVRIYVHNGAAQGLDPNHTTMNNIVANTSVSDNGTNHNISVTLSAGATNDGFVPASKSDSLNITTSGNATLQIEPGSGSVYDFNGNLLQSGLNVDGSTSLGSQQACFDFSRQILFKVKVVGAAVPVSQTPTGQINGQINGQLGNQCLFDATLNWNTFNVSQALVTFSDPNKNSNSFYDNDKVMSGDVNGSNVDVPWIQPNTNMRFSLWVIVPAGTSGYTQHTFFLQGYQTHRYILIALTDKR